MITFEVLVLLVIGLIFYILYSLFYNAFVEVGFAKWEASLIVFGSIIFGMVDIPLFVYRKWVIAINVGGAAIPVAISIYLMAKKKFVWTAVAGIILVSLITYNVTEVTGEGVTSSFPLWLAPPVIASIYSMMASFKKPKKAAPLAYVAGTLGVLVGADFLHMSEILRSPASHRIVASIGGASIFDMVFLAGIIAVLVDSLFILKRQA